LTPPHHQKGSRLFVCVHPGKKADRFYDVDGEFHVDIAARAIDGRANEHLVKFLGKVLSVPPSLLTIKRGATSRYKEVFFPVSEDDLMVRVRAVVSGQTFS